MELEVHTVEEVPMAEVEVHIGDIGMLTVIGEHTIDFGGKGTTTNAELVTYILKVPEFALD